MVGRVLADIFESEGYIDVVPSDIVAGFVLLRHVQKAKEHEMVQMVRGMGEGIASGSINLDEVDIAGGKLFPHQDSNPPPHELEEGASSSGGRSRATSTESSSAPTSTLRNRKRARVQRFQSGFYLARDLLKADNPEDRKVLEEGTYFETYAMAIYTWMMYLFKETPCIGSCHLTRRRCFGMGNINRMSSHLATPRPNPRPGFIGRSVRASV